MRIALLALAGLVWFGCKGKQAEKKAPAPTAGEASNRDDDPPADTERPALETPNVEGPGLVPVKKLATKITYSKTDIKVDEQNVVGIADDGLLDRERLKTLTRVLEDTVRSDDPIGIALDATHPYFRVATLLGELRRAGFRNLALLTGSGGKMIPVELGEAAEVQAAGLRLTITVKNGRISVWSMSGEEGTLQKPKFAMGVAEARSSLQPLTDALVEIVQRRWPDGKRPPSDRTVIIQFHRMGEAEQLLRLLAAVRTHGTLELFPNIYLGNPV